MESPLHTYLLCFLVYSVIYENFNSLTIRVHEIQPGDRQTDRHSNCEVLLIWSRFSLWDILNNYNVIDRHHSCRTFSFSQAVRFIG